MGLKVGIAGLRRGRGPLAVMKIHPRAEVVAVADPVAEVRDDVAAQYQVPTAVASFEELLASGIDAVFIATPIALHAEQSVMALEAGIHVLCEVPAVASEEEGRQLVAAVSRSSATYMFAENVNYFARTVAWKAFIDAGQLGDIFYGEAEYIHDCRSLMKNPDGSPTWRAFGKPIRYCTHSLGPLLAWTGDRCVSTVCLGSGSHCSEFGTPDLQVALFRTASGGALKVMCGFSLNSEPGRHYYCVYGTKGMLESGRAADAPDRGYLADQPDTRGPAPDLVPPVERPAPDGAKHGGHGDAEWFMIDDWVTAVLEGKPMPIDVHAGLDMTLPGVYAQQSADREGEPVAIPDSRDWGAP